MLGHREAIKGYRLGRGPKYGNNPRHVIPGDHRENHNYTGPNFTMPDITIPTEIPEEEMTLALAEDDSPPANKRKYT